MYFGIVISVFGFATCFGPIMGGALTDHASWRWCFWMYVLSQQRTFDESLSTFRNLPIGAVACLLVLMFLNLQNTDSPSRKLPLKTKIQRMDVVGAAILIAAVCCLLLALQWGGTASPWKSSRIIGLFVGFVLLSLTFGILQWKLGETATTPLRILRQRSICMGSSFVAFTNMAIFTVRYHFMTPSMQILLLRKPLACILYAFLLPSRTRCLSHDEWHKIHCARFTRNSGHCSVGCYRFQNWALCE